MVKDDCLDLAQMLEAAHQAGDTPELVALHDGMRAAMYKHKDLLGLSDDDLEEIDKVGPQARGGEPKPKP